LIFSCIAKNSFRKASRACASASSAAFVSVFGGGGALGFAVILRGGIAGLPSSRFLVVGCGVAAPESSPVSFVSSSSPKDNLLFARAFFFFFGRPSEEPEPGVSALFLAH
jgi:hypothetical protein